MRSAWNSIRAFVVVAFAVVGLGVIGKLALEGNEQALMALVVNLTIIVKSYFDAGTHAATT